MHANRKRRAFFALCLAAALLLVAPVSGVSFHLIRHGFAVPPSPQGEGLRAAAAVRGEKKAAEPARLPVVMYHQLSPGGTRAGDYVLPLWQFEADLKYLKARGYETVSVRQLLDWADGRAALPEKPCMITFDDGYETTGVCAAPLLEKYGFTAVVAPIGAVAQQYTDAPDDTLAYAHLNWAELRELAAGGTLEVQYHSWDMHELGARRGLNRRRGESEADYRAALEADLERFRAAAAENGVALAPSAAYPFGAYCALTEEILRENGLRLGFSCSEQVNVLTGAEGELFSLGRFNRAWGLCSADFFARWE